MTPPRPRDIALDGWRWMAGYRRDDHGRLLVCWVRARSTLDAITELRHAEHAGQWVLAGGPDDHRR